METINPYAPPQSEVERRLDAAQLNTAIQRDGKLVVFPAGVGYFPDRCVRCAGDCAGYQRSIKLIWTPRYIYFIFVLCFLAWLFLPIVIAGASDGRSSDDMTGILLTTTYALSLGGMLLSVIWGLIVRRRIRLMLGLCRRHRWQRLVGWILAVVGLIGLPLWVRYSDGAMLPLIFIMFLAWAIVLDRWCRPPLRIDHLDEDVVFAKGCGKAFLDTLPVYTRR